MPLMTPTRPLLCALDHVCTQVSQWYELVVFTASMEIYGSAVADKLDNNRNILKRRYYRQVLLTIMCVCVCVKSNIYDSSLLHYVFFFSLSPSIVHWI